MRPQEIVTLLKILCNGPREWYHKELASDLFISAAEVSYSLQRTADSGLIDSAKKKVKIQSLLEFLIHGIQYVFSEKPGSITRGLSTAHSHPMKLQFISDQQYVWADAESEERGLKATPLYLGVVKAAKKDPKLYLMLILIDVLRMGKTREKKVAIAELEKLMNQ